MTCTKYCISIYEVRDNSCLTWFSYDKCAWHKFYYTYIFFRADQLRILAGTTKLSDEQRGTIKKLSAITMVRCLGHRFSLVYLMVFSTIFQLYHGGQFYWWRKPEYPRRKPPTCQTLSHNVVLRTYRHGRGSNSQR